MDLVLATNNRGKLDEMQSILSGLGVRVLAVGDLVPGFDVEETGHTFAANARLKARAAFVATGLPSAADDSGLCVAGLDGAPGVRSSRFAGPGKSDAEKSAFLLSRLVRMTGAARRAWFACAVYAILPAGAVRPVDGVELFPEPEAGDGFRGLSTQGRLDGAIGCSPRGAGGFGYDPIFIPDDDPTRTLAEYTLVEKNAISHRGRAFALLRTGLVGL
jgi:XTP/dITP diphosphohydrolase